MQLTRSSVELLAPAGNFEALEAAIDAGADAVYLGGKLFNMRLHRDDMNFDNDALLRARALTTARGVKLYITINNLIRDEELPALREYLAFLGEKVKPDAILVQDFAVIKCIEDMHLDIPMHASVMMNTHNVEAMQLLKSHGITRVVAGREMPLSELRELRAATGLEIEYFVHGDMCIAESGQCIHSGVLFGQSSNRGRCLKPCRWAWTLVDEKTGAMAEDVTQSRGAHKLALKDMCMYREIPALVQSGVCSFKIEGRMRPADVVLRLVSIYRRAIDAYIADPVGYRMNEDDWRDLYEHRARDFSTCFALGQPTADDIGFDGKREPRFFSKAKHEAGLTWGAHDAESAGHAAVSADATEKKPAAVLTPRVVVRVRDLDTLDAALQGGANAVIVAGEAWAPRAPWTLSDIAEGAARAEKHGAHLLVATPRTTRARELGELEQHLTSLVALANSHPALAGVVVGNVGALSLTARILRSAARPLAILTDFGMNINNAEAAAFVGMHGASLVTPSLELPYHALRDFAEATDVPLAPILHGACEAMICDHDLVALARGKAARSLDNDESDSIGVALRDELGDLHPIRVDQYGRNHILFTRDLCLAPLFPQLARLPHIAAWRIEAQDYAPAIVTRVTRLYRLSADALGGSGSGTFLALDRSSVETLESDSPRKFGIGVHAIPNAQ